MREGLAEEDRMNVRERGTVEMLRRREGRRVKGERGMKREETGKKIGGG